MAVKEKPLIVLFCRIAFCSVFLTLFGCSKLDVGVIPVQLWWQGKPAACDSIINGKWRVDQAAFYLSQLHVGIGNEWDGVEFATDSPKLHLAQFDMESCTAQIPVNFDKRDAGGKQLSFTLGVPFSENHNNPVTQPWPLNAPHMFWTWRNGYKFLRIDMRSAEDAWAYHLGSVGCVSVSAVRAPEQECVQPNRTQQTMTIPESKDWVMALHLDRLLGELQPGMGNRCVMHGDKEPACEVFFQQLDNAQVSVFTLEPLAAGSH